MKSQKFLYSNFLFLQSQWYFFYTESFSVINRFFFFRICPLAFISSMNLVVVGSMTGLTGWFSLSASLSLYLICRK